MNFRPLPPPYRLNYTSMVRYKSKVSDSPYVAHLQPHVFVSPVQDGKTPMETLYSWQNGAKSLLSDFNHNRPDQ